MADDWFNCNRCRKRLTPETATRDRSKSGYVHREECRATYQKGKQGKPSVEAELSELEATDPKVNAAAVSYGQMVEKVTGRHYPVPELRETSEQIEARARAMTRG